MTSSGNELSKETKTFRFFDPYIFSTSIERQDNFCDIEITVIEKSYKSEEKIYNISYKNTYSDKSKASHCHPLSEKEYEEHMDGEIIVKNALSEQLVNFLLMDYDTLEKYSGNSTAEHYKSCVMRSICHFWD